MAGPTDTVAGVAVCTTARDEMRAKGILEEDLRPQTQRQLESAQEAYAAGRTDAGRAACQAVVTAVRAIRIDRDFVQGKAARANRLAGADSLQRLTEEESRVWAGSFDAMGEAYTDGRYDRTNRLLNRLFELIRVARSRGPATPQHEERP